jgi:hypothetical protein
VRSHRLHAAGIVAAHCLECCLTYLHHLLQATRSTQLRFGCKPALKARTAAPTTASGTSCAPRGCVDAGHCNGTMPRYCGDVWLQVLRHICRSEDCTGVCRCRCWAASSRQVRQFVAQWRSAPAASCHDATLILFSFRTLQASTMLRTRSRSAGSRYVFLFIDITGDLL